MPKVVAMCSCPRLGHMDFMGMSIAAFAQNEVEYRNLYGVFWGQVLDNGIRGAIAEDKWDYVITCDYDSIFNKETVAQLIKLAEQNPHADAICTMQMGRFSGLLVSTEGGYITREALDNESLVPVDTGHFGLTIFRLSALDKLAKPWFWSKPDVNGEWSKDGEGKLDEDIYFWDNFRTSGLQLYLAPRIVIGHLELLIKWPSNLLDGIYETTGDYYKHGMPSDVWK